MSTVKTDVDRGLVIYAELERLEAELKLIEERLKLAALQGEQVDLVDADREGKQFLAAGTTRIVPVILTSDKIMGEFGRDSEKHLKILSMAAGRLTDFFKPVHKFENRFDSGKKFRAQAEELLGKASAPGFVSACLARDKDGIPKSDIKVLWSDHKPA